MTPVYGDGRMFYTTPYIYGTCYRLPPAEAGPQPEKAWEHNARHLHRQRAAGGWPALRQRLPEAQVLALHRLDDRARLRYESKGLTTSSAVYADGRLYCLAEDGQAAMLRPTPRAVRDRRPVPFVPQEVHDAWAHPGSAPRPAVPALPRRALVLRRSPPKVTPSYCSKHPYPFRHGCLKAESEADATGRDKECRLA